MTPGGNISFVAVGATAGGNIISVAFNATVVAISFLWLLMPPSVALSFCVALIDTCFPVSISSAFDLLFEEIGIH